LVCFGCGIAIKGSTLIDSFCIVGELELYEEFLPALSRQWLINLYLYIACSDFYIVVNLKVHGGQNNGGDNFCQNRNIYGIKLISPV